MLSRERRGSGSGVDAPSHQSCVLAAGYVLGLHSIGFSCVSTMSCILQQESCRVISQTQHCSWVSLLECGKQDARAWDGMAGPHQEDIRIFQEGRIAGSSMGLIEVWVLLCACSPSSSCGRALCFDQGFKWSGHSHDLPASTT